MAAARRRRDRAGPAVSRWDSARRSRGGCLLRPSAPRIVRWRADHEVRAGTCDHPTLGTADGLGAKVLVVESFVTFSSLFEALSDGCVAGSRNAPSRRFHPATHRPAHRLVGTPAVGFGAPRLDRRCSDQHRRCPDQRPGIDLVQPGFVPLGFVPLGFVQLYWGHMTCTPDDLSRLVRYALEQEPSVDRAYLVHWMRAVGANQRWGVWAPARLPGRATRTVGRWSAAAGLSTRSVSPGRAPGTRWRSSTVCAVPAGTRRGPPLPHGRRAAARGMILSRCSRAYQRRD